MSSCLVPSPLIWTKSKIAAVFPWKSVPKAITLPFDSPSKQ